jgi:AAHS family 4-hydroxybenzoate transporter-like MFS transporter
MYAVAAHVYPTSCRAAGVGWAQGMGRLGGVLSAFLGAVLMARAGVSGFFVAITAVLGMTVLGVLLLRRHISPEVAEDAAPAPVRLK